MAAVNALDEAPRSVGWACVDFAQPLYAEQPRLRQWLSAPVQVLQAWDTASLQQVLQQVQALAQQGWWCIGGLRYEAAQALNPMLPVWPVEQGQAQGAGQPLAWFAICEAPSRVVAQERPADAAAVLPALAWHPSVDKAGFSDALHRVHEAIAAGHYYQVNYTQQLHGTAAQPMDGQALFAALQQAQPGGYAMWLPMGAEQVASVSPELFFDWHQPQEGVGEILTRPMKGTAARGATAQQDAAQAEHLQTSAKERAENVMVVDLLRNDLGQLAVTGTVQVPSLFNVQALPTVWQMTSDVRAQLPQGTQLLQVMQALFPCGSVTGAPKRAAMQAITQLERAPRGWYCGALGLVRPDGAGGVRATFNVPIRTVVLQGAPATTLRCGIGSGITADASVQGEWQEWRAKQAFVERVSMDFDVITTMALEGGQLRHRALHIQRLQAAAAHFGFPWDAQALALTLQHVCETHPSGQWRVRVALSRMGLWQCDVQASAAPPAVVYLQLAEQALPEAHSEFVRFKTSRRAHYERFAPAAHVLDTVLWNEAGEITEGTRGNIAACLEGQWITPPLQCGLLNGIGRQVALAQGRVVERVLRVADVPRVQQWAFVNSLRGWLPAQLLPAGRTVP